MTYGKEPMAGNLEHDTRARLRERLIELRDDALDGVPIAADVASRAVVSDDGREIRLTLYAEAGAVAAVVLDPVRAIALAGRLIEAALLRLPG